MTAAALLLAACGDDDPEVATDEPPPPSDRYQHSADPDAVVLRISDEGGFVPAEHSFTNAPRLLITGDGRLIHGGPVIAIYPGPLLPNLLQQSISEAGIQRLFKLADEWGLLADVAYPRPANIADAADTVMTITVGGETFEHRAYALGLGGGPEVARRTRPGLDYSTSWALPQASRTSLRRATSGPSSRTAATRT